MGLVHKKWTPDEAKHILHLLHLLLKKAQVAEM